MHELQQLHGELDVAQSAGPELQLVRHVVRVDVLRDALAHALHAADEVLACGAARPSAAGPRRTPGRARGPPRAAAPSAAPGTPSPSPSGRSRRGGRTSVRTSAPCLPSGRRFASTSHSGGSASIPARPCMGSRRAGWRCRSRATLPRVLIRRAGDEDHVDVADVVELARAGLAHADDREPGEPDLATTGLGSAADDGPGDGERGLERGGGRVGERRATPRRSRRPGLRRPDRARRARRARAGTRPAAGPRLRVAGAREPALGVARRRAAPCAAPPRSAARPAASRSTASSSGRRSKNRARPGDAPSTRQAPRTRPLVAQHGLGSAASRRPSRMRPRSASSGSALRTRR